MRTGIIEKQSRFAFPSPSPFLSPFSFVTSNWNLTTEHWICGMSMDFSLLPELVPRRTPNTERKTTDGSVPCKEEWLRDSKISRADRAERSFGYPIPIPFDTHAVFASSLMFACLFVVACGHCHCHRFIVLSQPATYIHTIPYHTALLHFPPFLPYSIFCSWWFLHFLFYLFSDLLLFTPSIHVSNKFYHYYHYLFPLWTNFLLLFLLLTFFFTIDSFALSL